MKVQMGPIAEQLDVFVSRSPDGFQEINGHRLAAINLRRDSEVHHTIVQAPDWSRPECYY